MSKLDVLIAEAERWRAWHKARGEHGRIEALAASIRLIALKDARKAVQNG